MRTNIYYWKCDNPLPTESKLRYNEKYALADITPLVRQAAREHFSGEPLDVQATGSQGNHYTYLIRYPEQTFFFRADDGQVDDDYMDAESAAITLVQQHQVPVPRVYHTDTTRKIIPVRYQILEQISGKSINAFHQDGSLDNIRVARQAGSCIARLHGIKLPGYGFFNTEILRRENRIVGLDQMHRDYFYKRLDDHLRYLRDTGFLTPQNVDEIQTLFQRHETLLELPCGSLVHKDLAFWNMMGTPTDITAIVDWDDVIIGDPVDDLAILKCFYNDDIFQPLLEGYQDQIPLPDLFYPKLWLFLVRNMLWKAVVRTFMKYFEMDGNFFILNRDNRQSLRQFTFDRLNLGIQELRKL
jgi:aminoglycoside phosphotransferase (APT) family kinase protein